MSAAILAIIFSGMAMGVIGILAWVVVSAVNGRRDRDRERLAVLDKALDRPDLDTEMRRELLTTLSRERDRSPLSFLRRGSFWRTSCFAIGWVTLFICGGIALLTVMGVTYAPYEATLTPCVFALALMTLPTAIGEFVRRDQQGAEAR